MVKYLKVAALFIMWLMATAVIVFVFGSIARIPAAQADELPVRGKSIQAKVTHKRLGDLLNQQTLSYEYVVNGQDIIGGSAVTDRTFQTTNVGDVVRVFYFPDDPSESGFDWEGMRESTRRSYWVIAFLEIVFTIVIGGFTALFLVLSKIGIAR